MLIVCGLHLFKGCVIAPCVAVPGRDPIGQPSIYPDSPKAIHCAVLWQRSHIRRAFLIFGSFENVSYKASASVIGDNSVLIELVHN